MADLSVSGKIMFRPPPLTRGASALIKSSSQPTGSFDHFSQSCSTGMRHDRPRVIELAKQPCLDGGMTWLFE